MMKARTFFLGMALAALGAGQADTAIERGRLLELEADDPGEHLDKNEGKGQGVHLLVGIWSTGGDFTHARPTSKGKKSRVYEMLVPFDTDFRLQVLGRKLDLKDNQGKAKKEGDVPELLREPRSASKSPKRIVVQVKGVKP
jgi:hypothetical protein